MPVLSWAPILCQCNSTLPLPTAIDTQERTGVTQETQVAGQENLKGRCKALPARGHDCPLFVHNLSTNLVPNRDTRQTARQAFYGKHCVSRLIPVASAAFFFFEDASITKGCM